MTTPKDTWIRTDFNGFLETDLLCLAHEKTVINISDKEIELQSGMIVTAYDEDEDDNGNPDKMLVTGVVEPSPEFAQCRGSIWSIRVNEYGVQWESEINKNT